jgi:predicted transcriptional regulator
LRQRRRPWPKPRQSRCGFPSKSATKLDRLAKVTQRSRSYLVVEALDAFTRDELEIVEGVLEGIEDMKAGRVYTTEEVRAHLDELLENAASGAEARNVAAR